MFLRGRNTKTKRALLGATLSEHYQGQPNMEGLIPIAIAIASVGFD